MTGPSVGDRAEAFVHGHTLGAALVDKFAALIRDDVGPLLELVRAQGATEHEVAAMLAEVAGMFRQAADRLDPPTRRQ